MKKRINLLAALILGLSFGPAAAADQRVPGESLDNGLGKLPASYTAAEYNRPGWVAGESIDTGLGELTSTYTAAECARGISGPNPRAGFPETRAANHALRSSVISFSTRGPLADAITTPF